MTGPRFHSKTKHINITTTLWVVVMFLLLSSSCTGDKAEVVEVAFNPDNTYTMRTTDIISLISDSGMTRYRLTSPEMLVYDKAEEPYSYFPQGIYGEQFDTLFVAQATFEADTAYHWNKKQLLKAIGNVKVENLQGERFETDYLYWDQKAKRIYSDAYMRIEQKDQIITGIGFESNEDMSQYRIYHPQGSFPVNEEPKDTTQSEPVQRDTPLPVREAPPRHPSRSRSTQRPVIVQDTLQIVPTDE